MWFFLLSQEFVEPRVCTNIMALSCSPEVAWEMTVINLKERRGSNQSAFCSLSYEWKEMERETIIKCCKRGEEALVGVRDSIWIGRYRKSQE
jgi:hypothetical protein